MTTCQAGIFTPAERLCSKHGSLRHTLTEIDRRITSFRENEKWQQAFVSCFPSRYSAVTPP